MEPFNIPSSINGLDNRVGNPLTAGQSSTDQNLFLQLLTGILAENQSGSSAGSLGTGDLLTPLLMNLVEQMMADQVHSQDYPTSPAAGVQSAAYLPSASRGQIGSPEGEPVHGPLTQGFHPGHNGLDFGVVVGTPAHATMPGKVIYAGWNNQGYGNLVVVQNGAYKTYYGHLSEIPVQVGRSVSAGQTIGLTGNTGNSTGPHLHYEVRLNDKPIDPTSFTLG